MRDHSIVLRYPSAWMSDVNPAHEAARRDTALWLRDLGVVAEEGALRVLETMNVGWYGGAPFPRAPHDELTTIMRFFTLWIFHDEVLEGLGVSAPRVLAGAVRGEPERCPEGSPFLRGWWELGRRFRTARSARWLARFSGRFADWLSSVDAEARLAAEASRRGAPSFASYMEVRSTNIGALPTICWIEYAARRELDGGVLADPDLAAAERLAARIVVFQNDIAGFDKDAQRGWPNAVSSIAADRGISIAAAFPVAAALHDAHVGELVAVCNRIADRHGDAARFWVLGLAHLVSGLARWHVSTPRYTATLPSGEAVRVSVGPSTAPW